jgi:hypothetical protein
MKVDSEFAGLLVAVGFLVMGLVSMPIATGFVLGAITLGVVVALLLRFTPKKFTRVVLGTVIMLTAIVLWWEGHKPPRPRIVSSNALYVLPNNVPLTLHKTGYWLDCWFDEHANVDRCKLSHEDGTGSFEEAGGSGVFLGGGTISGNSSDGIRVLAASEAIFSGPTITANGGVGVQVLDGSFAAFLAASITGNLSGLDVDCEPQFPMTRFVSTEQAVLQTALSPPANRR